MKNFNRAIVAILVLSLVCPMVVPVFASGNNLVGVPENATYFDDGSYVFKIDDDVYFFDNSLDEVVLAVDKYEATMNARATHVPKDLTPYWIWFHTDGPYSVSINMNAVNRILQSAGNWAEVSIALGLGVAVLQWAYEACNGNFNVNKTVWEIDDGYHAYDDPTYFHIISYFYSNSSCTNLLDTDSFTYHG